MNLTLKLLCIPHLFDHAGGRLTVRVRQRTKYIVRPEEKRRRESSSFLPPVAFCMHALPPPTHHCVGGKSGVRWECRGGGKRGEGAFLLSVHEKYSEEEKATKCEGSRCPRRRRDSPPPLYLQSKLETSLLQGRGTWGL